MRLVERFKGWLAGDAKAAPRELVRATVFLPGEEPVSRRLDPKLAAREGYEGSSTVYACIRLKADAVAGLATLLMLHEGTGRAGRRELTEHPLLRLLARPNPNQSGAELLEEIASHYEIAGIAYVYVIDTQAMGPRELWSLNPADVKIKHDARGQVAGYAYRPSGATEDMQIDPAKMIVFRSFSATNDPYGFAAVQAASRAIDTERAAGRWNHRLLLNAGRPSGVFTHERYMPPEQLAELSAAIKRGFDGPENAGRPIIMHGGLQFEKLGLAPIDMDFLGSLKDVRRQICRVHGVPPELVGDPESRTYASYAEARASFYQETVLPLADRFVEVLNARLVPRFGARLRLSIDRDGIEALQADRERLWARVQGSDWLTVNEKRRATGYDDIAGGDVLLVSPALEPLESSSTVPPKAGA